MASKPAQKPWSWLVAPSPSTHLVQVEELAAWAKERECKEPGNTGGVKAVSWVFT